MSLFPKAATFRTSNGPTLPAAFKLITDLKVVRFGMVGVVNTTIDLMLFSLLVQGMAMPVAPANVLSYGTGILNSFLMNRAWTFQHRARGRLLMRSLLLFVGINLLGLALSTLLVLMFSTVMNPILAKILSVPLIFVWNYLASRHLAFGGPETEAIAPARG